MASTLAINSIAVAGSSIPTSSHYPEPLRSPLSANEPSLLALPSVFNSLHSKSDLLHHPSKLSLAQKPRRSARIKNGPKTTPVNTDDFLAFPTVEVSTGDKIEDLDTEDQYKSAERQIIDKVQIEEQVKVNIEAKADEKLTRKKATLKFRKKINFSKGTMDPIDKLSATSLVTEIKAIDIPDAISSEKTEEKVNIQSIKHIIKACDAEEGLCFTDVTNGFPDKAVDLPITGRRRILQNPEEVPNEDFCWNCRGSGKFICCESCPRSFHFLCTNPPMEEELASSASKWFCRHCNAQKKIKKKQYARKESRGRTPARNFLQLVSSILEGKNPCAFSLSNEILHTFSSVGCDAFGNYVDLEEYRSPGAQTIRWNPEDLYGIPLIPQALILDCISVDSMPLRNHFKEKGSLKNGDENKNPRMSVSAASYMCHGCGGSALRGPMIECDFCSFSWHLDCLNPPMAMVPAASKKWLCPLHIAHLRQGSRRRRLLTAPVPRLYSNSTLLEQIDDMDEVQIVLAPDDSDASHVRFRTRARGASTELPPPSTSRIIQLALMVPENCIKLAFMDAVNGARRLERLLQLENQWDCKYQWNDGNYKYRWDDKSWDTHLDHSDISDIRNHRGDEKLFPSTPNHHAGRDSNSDEEPLGILLGAIEAVTAHVHE
ncbi:hypothetical protein MDAP_000462 [Mitosporidium daphniae]